MRAEEGNKVYTITEEQKEHYQNDGFDILSDDGKIIAYGIGKNVPYEKYEALKSENEALRKELENLKSAMKELEPETETVKEPAETKTGRSRK